MNQRQLVHRMRAVWGIGLACGVASGVAIAGPIPPQFQRANDTSFEASNERSIDLIEALLGDFVTATEMERVRDRVFPALGPNMGGPSDQAGVAGRILSIRANQLTRQSGDLTALTVLTPRSSVVSDFRLGGSASFSADGGGGGSSSASSRSSSGNDSSNGRTGSRRFDDLGGTITPGGGFDASDLPSDSIDLLGTPPRDGPGIEPDGRPSVGGVPAAVPLPAPLAMGLVGLAGVMIFRRRG